MLLAGHISSGPGRDPAALWHASLCRAKYNNAPRVAHDDGFLPCEQSRGLSTDGCLGEVLSLDYRVEERTISRADI